MIAKAVFGVVLLVFVQSLIVQAKWKKITHFPICFEGRNNKPGHFMYVGDEAIVGAMRLEWTSGTIRCVSDKAYDSRWGCHHHSSYRSYPFNVIVTDSKDSIIYPLPKYIKTSGLWYVQPGQDDKESSSLVFSNFDNPLVLQRLMQLKIWYGEDLRNSAEGDNQGRVCVHIHAYIISDNTNSGVSAGGGAASPAALAAVKLVSSLKASFTELLKSK